MNRLAFADPLAYLCFRIASQYTTTFVVPERIWDSIWLCISSSSVEVLPSRRLFTSPSILACKSTNVDIYTYARCYWWSSNLSYLCQIEQFQLEKIIVENASLYTDKHMLLMIFQSKLLMSNTTIPVSKNDSGNCILCTERSDSSPSHLKSPISRLTNQDTWTNAYLSTSNQGEPSMAGSTAAIWRRPLVLPTNSSSAGGELGS